jgi:hypothetical protein
MSQYYDDNFGHWNMDQDDREELIEFYHRLQRTNVEKVCEGCQQTVRIQPHYALCNSCADKAESGWCC